MSKRRGQIGGQGGIISRALWVFLCCCIVLAIYKGLGGTPESVFGFSKEKGNEINTALHEDKNPLVGLKNWFMRQAPGSGGSSSNGGGAGSGSGGKGGTGSPATATNFDYDKLKSSAKMYYPINEQSRVAYDRKQWNHWIEVRKCWTVREQVLYRDAVAGSVKLLDAAKKPTNDVNKACAIVGGQWVDRYTGKTFNNPKDMDIDHMVPLRNAAVSGGQSWSEKLKGASPANPSKEFYANYLGNPHHLVAVSATANRAKGDKGPEAWMPPNKAFQKEYVAAWLSTKTEFGLSMTPKEQEKVISVLSQ